MKIDQADSQSANFTQPTNQINGANSLDNSPYITFGKYHFIKGVWYRFYRDENAKWFTQDADNTTIFHFERPGNSTVSWDLKVTRDHYHGIEPQLFNNHMDKMPGWMVVKADKSEYVNITHDPILY
ncbi:MAG: hypothetical protein ACHQF4_08800 [Sphingobacteriales bacterium]